ncbi:MAG: hypothetical protein NDJ92_15740 [Thermoanaerobaculia bacterium]|nr:hypothetical protein [Thermoanaerobaculia bacterium]
MRARHEIAFERIVRFLYPTPFASCFASEMSGVFANGYAEARARGRIRALAFVVRELASLAEGALVAHSEDRTPRTSLTGRGVAILAALLASPWAPALLAALSLLALGALAGDLIAARGLYWRATQLALVALLAGVAFRLGAVIARDPRAIVRSFAIVTAALVVALGILLVATVDEAASFAVAPSGASFDASLPGVHLRVVTGPDAQLDGSGPPAGFEPTRTRTMTAARGDLAVRTQLFARGVDLAYALVAIALLTFGAAGGFRIERRRHRIA